MAVIAVLALVAGIWLSSRAGHTDDDGRIPIVFWNAVEFGEEIYAACHQFEVENPKYKVVISSAVSRDFTSDAQRLMSAITGGVPPDVCAFDRFAIGEWAGRGALTDLTPYIDAQPANDPDNIVPADYYPFALAEASYAPPGSGEKPKLFGIPTALDIRILVANSDHLRQAGLVDAGGNPRPPQTWEELQKAAKTLSRYDSKNNMTRLGFAPSYGNSWLYLYAFQAGGNFLSPDGSRAQLDSPEVRRALRFMTDVYDDLGGAKQVMGFQASFQAGTQDPFLQGLVSMKIDGDWNLTIIADWKRDMDFTVAPAPMPADRVTAGVPPVTWAGGYSVIIPSTSQQKDGAFKLIRFLISKRTAKFLEQGGRERREADGRIFLPKGDANRMIYEDAVWRNITNNPRLPQSFKKAYAVVLNLLPTTKVRPPSPVGQLLWNEHVRAYEAAVNHRYADVARGDKDVEVKLALETAQGNVQRQLDALLAPPPPHVVNWPVYFMGYAAVVAAPFVVMAVVYRRRKKAYSYRGREVSAAMMFLSPWVIGMIVLTGGPILFSIVMSFTRYDVLTPARYVGLDNYLEIFSDASFYKSLYNTAFMVLRIPLGLAIGLAIAMLMNQKVRGIGVYRTAYYLPSIVPVVASSLLWIYLLNPNIGAINVALTWLIDSTAAHWLEWLINAVHTFDGGPFRFSAPSWLSDPAWSKPSIILMGLWTAGGGMIIWLAGLQSIPRQLYEAATVDGAGRWQQFRHVTLPMLSPYILFNAVIGLIGTFQIFSEAFIMTAGGPDDSTMFYAYYLFKSAFQFFRMGYASALAWILFMIVLLLTLVQLWLSKRWVHYDRA